MLATEPTPIPYKLPLGLHHSRWNLPTAPLNPATTPSLNHGDIAALDDAIITFNDYLFFIAHNVPGVLHPNWHLIAVDLTASREASSEGVNGIYMVDFFVFPLADRYSSDVSRKVGPRIGKYC